MKRVLLALAVAVAVPAFAAVGPEVTLPVAGHLVLTGHTYMTEVTMTNHRDQRQYLAVEVIDGRGPARLSQVFSLEPHQTLFRDTNWGLSVFGNVVGQGIGAVRFTAIHTPTFEDGLSPDFDIEKLRDPDGQLEVKAHIVNERGPFGLYGSSRQEVEAIPSSEYRAKEAVFVGVLHQPPTYTNVGIVNLSTTETVTFYVQYQYLERVPVVVPPLGFRQLRVTGGRSPVEEGNAGRYVVITPEWADDPASTKTTPWVAYTSTVDGITGDAFSGVRVPPDTFIRR